VEARLAVFGHPVAHSLSPRIHAAFGEATGHPLTYAAIDAPVDAFEDRLGRFLADGALGANVTLPFKERAWAFVDRRVGDAEASGAVNTVHRDGSGTAIGHNTDGTGLLRDLGRLGTDPAGLDVCILGAGGAVRGILPALLAARPRSVLLLNRTAARARDLVGHFAAAARAAGVELEAADPAAPTRRPPALVLNGTSASLGGALPPMPPDLFAAGPLAYDLAYGSDVFTAAARARGAERVSDGLGMLVEQAAAAFEIWFGTFPPTDPVLRVLRER
jgi:shikimate dehydrogenase